MRWVYSFHAERIELGPGITLTISPIPGQLGAIVKYVSGGSLSLVGFTSSLGTTFATSNLYTIDNGEIMSLDTSGYLSFYATGSTVTFSLLRSRSDGF